MPFWDYDQNNSYTNPIPEYRLHIRPDGSVWTSCFNTSVVEEANTKIKYPKIYEASCDIRDFNNAFRISEYGHIIHTRLGKSVAVGRLRNPLLWDDEHNDSQYTNSDTMLGQNYEGLVYGIGYTLRANADITFHDKSDVILEDSEICCMIIKAADKIGARSGKFYVKDNGVMIGVFGEAGRRIYVGRLKPSKKNDHQWEGWFPDNHQEIPILD